MKKSFVFLIALVAVLSLSGCGDSIADEKEIVEDLNSTSFLTQYEEMGYMECKVDKIDVEKRNTVKKQTDTVYCQIFSSNENVSICQDAILTYNFYTQGGWILDTYEVTNLNEISPLKGVDDGIVNKDIENYGKYKDYEIKNHETDLDNHTDIVTVSVSAEGELCKISGSISMNYYFENGSWIKSSEEKNDDYTEKWNFSGTWILDERSDNSGIFVTSFVSQDDSSVVVDDYYFAFLDDGSFWDYYEHKDVKFYLNYEQNVFEDIGGSYGGGFNVDTLTSGEKLYKKYSDELFDVDEFINQISNLSDGSLASDEYTVLAPEEKVFPILCRAYDSDDYPCPVMIQDCNEMEELVYGTYEEMLESCVDDGITMYAPPVRIEDSIYTVIKWDAYPDQWTDELLTYEEFVIEVNHLAGFDTVS